jgi:hypothetical protein
MQRSILVVACLFGIAIASPFPPINSRRSNLQNEMPCPAYPEAVPLYVNNKLPEVVQSALADLDKYLGSQQEALQLPGIIFCK